MAGTVGVILDQVVQVEHRVLGQHERSQRLQVGLADRLAALDPLEVSFVLEQVPEHLLDAVAVGGELQAFELDGVLLPLDQRRVFLDVDDLGRQRAAATHCCRYCMTPRSLAPHVFELGDGHAGPELVGAGLGDGGADGLHLGQVHPQVVELAPGLRPSGRRSCSTASGVRSGAGRRAGRIGGPPRCRRCCATA